MVWAVGIWELHLKEQDLRWQERAACIGEDPDLFFPKKVKTRRDNELVLTAKAICAGCPVREECLDYAIDLNIAFGIWGGLSERQRRKIRSVRRSVHGRRLPPHL